jgi:hypothetical protein
MARLPEVMIGLVGPLGTPLDEIEQALKGLLADVADYDSHTVRLSRQLDRLTPAVWERVWEETT